MDLKGTCAIVTGGGRGIGSVTALQLAEAGARVVVLARSTTEIDAVAGEVKKAGGEAIARQADCVDPGSMRAVVDEAIDLYGGVEILVNNAGTPQGGGKPVEASCDPQSQYAPRDFSSFTFAGASNLGL